MEEAKSLNKCRKIKQPNTFRFSKRDWSRGIGPLTNRDQHRWKIVSHCKSDNGGSSI